MDDEIYLGIFWFYGEQLIGKKMSCPLAPNNENQTLLLDSPFQHITEWEINHLYLAKYPELLATEYQSLPRGRALFSIKKNCFYVYMDRTLFNQHCKNEIKLFYQINKKIIFKSDEHYQVF